MNAGMDKSNIVLGLEDNSTIATYSFCEQQLQQQQLHEWYQRQQQVDISSSSFSALGQLSSPMKLSPDFVTRLKSYANSSSLMSSSYRRRRLVPDLRSIYILLPTNATKATTAPNIMTIL